MCATPRKRSGHGRSTDSILHLLQIRVHLPKLMALMKHGWRIHHGWWYWTDNSPFSAHGLLENLFSDIERSMVENQRKIGHLVIFPWKIPVQGFARDRPQDLGTWFEDGFPISPCLRVHAGMRIRMAILERCSWKWNFNHWFFNNVKKVPGSVL